MLVPYVQAQQPLQNLEPAEYFDFWLGRWDLSWQNSEGVTDQGTNTIERVLGGHVIKENFEATSGKMKGYVGKSFSVYDPKTETWHQTWVDNQGAYLDFIGKFEGNKRIFIRKTQNPEGNSIWQRMVFYDIQKDSFNWRWEQSTDNGKTWDLQWKIAYRRH